MSTARQQTPDLLDANDPACAFTSFERVYAITNAQVTSVECV